MEEANGNTRRYFYEFGVLENQEELVQRVAIAYIPDSDLAQTELTTWLSPLTPEQTDSLLAKQLPDDSETITCYTCFSEPPQDLKIIASSLLNTGDVTCVITYCDGTEATVSASSLEGDYSVNVDFDWIISSGGSTTSSGGGTTSGDGTSSSTCAPPYACGTQQEATVENDSQQDDEEQQEIPKPCEGDPVKDMELVSPGGSGLDGARFHPDSNTSPRKDFSTGIGRAHNGIDLACNVGDPIFAPHGGTVEIVGTQVNAEGIGYGNFLRVDSNINGQSINWGIAHLGENNGLITNGQNINAGDVIGICGISGRGTNPSSNPHIHMEYGTKKVFIKRNASSNLDPEEFLNTEFDENGDPINNSQCNQ